MSFNVPCKSPPPEQSSGVPQRLFRRLQARVAVIARALSCLYLAHLPTRTRSAFGWSGLLNAYEIKCGRCARVLEVWNPALLPEVKKDRK